MKHVMKAGFVFLFAAISSMAIAQESGHLNVTRTVQKEEVSIDLSGARTTKLVDAATVVPGDEVIYTVTFHNISGEPAENVVITNPLPAELTYVDGSAFAPGAETVFSVDGGKTFASPDALTVSENGEERSATANDFTHIRWVMRNELAAGMQGMSQFRAQLN
jgi:uncharacterized repeat protein (TIGR01451 family)